MSRQAIIDAAAAEIGPYDRAKVDKYWLEVLPPGQYTPGLKLAWCGAFALYCLHRAGLALDKHWAIGKGFLLVPPHVLATTKHPEPGDIGYLAQPFQHHFVVESVSGDLVHSIDGNQPDVARRTRKLESCVYYSIAPLLAASDTEPSPPPSAELPHHPSPAEVQHAVNGVLIGRLGEPASAAGPTPALLTVDGIIGPKSQAALKWVQALFTLPVTGQPDDATCRALGLT